MRREDFEIDPQDCLLRTRLPIAPCGKRLVSKCSLHHKHRKVIHIGRTLDESDILVAVHGSPLRVAAELPVSRGADGPAASTVVACCAAFLQSQKLFGTESLVMDLASRFNQVLQVSASQEVPQVDEFAVVLIFDVDNTPAILSAANLLAVDDNVFLATDNSERNDVLRTRLLDTNQKHSHQ